jgi:hypothetical protein
MKLVVAILVLIVLGGCREPSRTWTNINHTNNPDSREREVYYERCVGQSVHSDTIIPESLRVACVTAVLGKLQ